MKKISILLVIFFLARSVESSQIIIDAGHGGHSFGATNNHTYEKDIVLSVSLELENMFKKTSHTVVLTRNKDIYLSLNERRQIIKKYPGYIFVSIHCNADSPTTHNLRGVEFYYFDGLTTSSKRYIDQSKLFCQIMKNSFGKSEYEGFRLKTKEDKYRKNENIIGCRFQVLQEISPKAGILIEIGYIDNPKEVKYLSSVWFQKLVAKLIFNSIKEYDDDHQ